MFHKQRIKIEFFLKIFFIWFNGLNFHNHIYILLLGHSKTWRMKSAGTSDNTKNNGRDQEQGDVDDDYENEPIVSHSIQHVWLEHPIPDKLFFLATGEGCGTAEVCKAMKSSPLLGPFCGSEFWGFSLLKI